MNSTIFYRFSLFATMIVMSVVAVSTCFSQSRSVETTNVAAKNVTELNPQVKPNVPATEENKTAPTGDSVSVFPEGAEKRVVTAKSFSDWRKELSEKPLDAKDVNALPPLRRKQTSPGNNDWHISIAPYFYMSGLRGTVAARGRSIELDASFGNILDNLDIGIMSTFEVRKGRFVSLNDILWIKMSNKRDTPQGLYSTAKVGVNLFIFDPEIGYRLVDSKAGSFDVLGGARIWSVETNLNVTSGLLPGFDVSQRKSLAAPVVGVRGVYNITPKFFVNSKFDIGGAGIGADLTTQFYGGAGFRITPKFAVVGGYRYLQVDYDDSQGFLFDTRMNGILLGAKFDF